MPALPKFRYQLQNGAGQPYRLVNGVVSNPNTPVSLLENDPENWEELELSASTNDKYFTLTSVLSNTFTFVREAATILRQIMYTKRGFSSDCYVRIFQLDLIRYKVYNDAYSAPLDFTTFKDILGHGVETASVEGGLRSLLDAKDAVDFDVLCSENNKNAVKIYLTPITLQDKLNYSEVKVDAVDGGRHIIPFVLKNNEGDTVGIKSGSPNYEPINGNVQDFYIESQNYFVSPFLVPVDFHFVLTIRVDRLDSENQNGTYQVRKVVASDTAYISSDILTGIAFPFTGIQTRIVDFTVTLQPGEKLFLEGFNLFQNGNSGGVIYYNESPLSIAYLNSNTPSFAYSLDGISLMQSLLDKASGTPGKYTFVSDYLTANPGLRVTCGDALRNTQRKGLGIDAAIDDYYISTSIQDVFKAYSVRGPMCLITQGNVLRMEPLGYQYGTGSTIMDAGEMSGVTLSPLKDKIFGSVKYGYPDQNYDQRSGKYEFNQTRVSSAPTLASNLPLDISSPIRADCYGIEFIRSVYSGKDSTDNQGDKEPFLIDCDPDSLTVPFEAIGQPANTGVADHFTLLSGDANRFKPDSYFTISGGTPGDKTYKVFRVEGSVVYTWENIITGAYVGSVTFDNYLLYRPAYDVITGVLDNSVYNTRVSPANQFKNWMSYFNSIFFQQPGEQFSIPTGTKNLLLHTELNGVIVDENDPVTIGSGDSALFLPYQIEGTTEISQPFQQVVSNLQKGDVRLGVNGKDVFCLPLFCKMSTKPATNAAQDWILTISTKTSLMTLLSLSNTGFTIQLGQNSLYMSQLQPIPWKKYNYQKQPGINQLQDWQGWEEEQFPDYPSQPDYFQKWLDTDTIKMWAPSNGVNSIVLYVYDCEGKVAGTYPWNTLTSTAMFGTVVLKYLALPASTFTHGRYYFVLQSGSNQFAISRHEIKTWNPAIPDNTRIVKYSNSYNTLDYYQELGEIQYRLEIQQGLPMSKADVVSYTDDLRETELLSGRTYSQVTYYLGFPTGLPVPFVKLMEDITATMDFLSVDDLRVSRPSDSQIEQEQIPGYPFMFPSLTMNISQNQGNIFDEITGQVDQQGRITVFVDAQGTGDPNGFISFEIGD